MAVWQYVTKRILLTIPMLFGVSVLIFLLMNVVPGDIADIILGEGASKEDVEIIREELGLDQPLHVQYFRFLGNALRGDLGRSFRTEEEVLEKILHVYPISLKLAATSVGFAFVFGVPLGVIASIRRNSWLDYLCMVGALIGVSIPRFWLGLLLIFLFSVFFQLLPTMSGELETLDQLIMPALSMSVFSLALVAMTTRATMLEVLTQDYVITARSKGLHEPFVVFRHALKNAFVPILTVLSTSFGYQLAGTVIIERIFSINGLGNLILEAIDTRDYPFVQGGVFFFALSFMLVNLITDMFYTIIDPRISYGRQD